MTDAVDDYLNAAAGNDIDALMPTLARRTAGSARTCARGWPSRWTLS